MDWTWCPCRHVPFHTCFYISNVNDVSWRLNRVLGRRWSAKRRGQIRGLKCAAQKELPHPGVLTVNPLLSIIQNTFTATHDTPFRPLQFLTHWLDFQMAKGAPQQSHGKTEVLTRYTTKPSCDPLSHSVWDCEQSLCVQQGRTVQYPCSHRIYWTSVWIHGAHPTHGRSGSFWHHKLWLQMTELCQMC